MPQQLTHLAVARCLARGVAGFVADQGPVHAAPVVGTDRTTAARWRDDADPELVTAHAVAGVIVAQVRMDGSSSLLAALTALVHEAGQQRGEDADAVCLRALVELGEALAEDGRALANGHVDLVEARRLLPLLARAEQLARRGQAVLRDKLARGLA
jgi:hypothetical protein